MAKFAAILLSAVMLRGQEAEILEVLPDGAKVIETAVVKPGSRTLVLWMLKPKPHYRPESIGCSEMLFGDHWMGPTRLSLFDPPQRRIINTVAIQPEHPNAALFGDAPDGFGLPFRVANGFYWVPDAEPNQEGKPTILRLRDLTGEGVRGQFVLYDHEVCGVAKTLALGYSPRADRVVLYRVQVVADGQSTVEDWSPMIFARNGPMSGAWTVDWEPGHGCACRIRDRVRFDRARQIFLDHRQVTPYAIAPRPGR